MTWDALALGELEPAELATPPPDDREAEPALETVAFGFGAS